MSAELAVAIGFIVFVGIVLYLQVPSKIAALLDRRAERIRNQLEEARLAREEAQQLLASFERKQKDVQREADAIVERAKSEAKAAAEKAKADLKESIERKLRNAEERIAQAEASATREVRNAAASTAVIAAKDVIAGGMNDQRADALIDDGISSLRGRLN